MKNNISEIFLMFCGILGMLTLAVGLFFIARLIPPPAPSATAAEIVAFYQASPGAMKTGLIFCLFGTGLILPVLVSISINMSRAEQGAPFLAITQLVTGTLALLFLMIPFLLWMTCAFRPERDPELIMLVNDIGWLIFTTGVTPFMLQLLSISICGLRDKREHKLLPRWICFMGLWMVVGTFPALLIPYFTDGPFAWDGVISFWLPIFLFSAWLSVIINWLVMNKRVFNPLPAVGEISPDFKDGAV